MSKSLLLSMFVVIFLTWSCASKRYTRQGYKLEQAGFYEVAAGKYYMAVVKNDRNLKAQSGLKKTGQIALENKLNRFDERYKANIINEAVRTYNEANEFKLKLMQVNCHLNFPSQYIDAFNEIKNIYLEERYLAAVSLMENENYTKAEEVLFEMQITDSNYLDIDELKEIAHYEPMFREAKVLFEHGLYRQAYYSFDEIAKEKPDYKDVIAYKNEAYRKAMVVIAIGDIKNFSEYRGEAVTIAKLIEKELVASKSIFMNVIDIENTELLNHAYTHELSLLSNDHFILDAAKLLNADLLIDITLEKLNIQKTPLKEEIMKGFVKETIKAEPGTLDERYKYHKVKYKEYKQTLKISCNLRYQVISSKTGTVLISDNIRKFDSHSIHYAEYEGKSNKLIPGYWEDKKESFVDEIKEEKNEIMELQKLLKAQKKLVPVSTMQYGIYNEIARQVAYKIVQNDAKKN